MSRRNYIHFGIFCFFFSAWSIALLAPVPRESAATILGGQQGVTIFGKTLHVLAYIFLTVLGGSLPWQRLPRLVLLVVLFGHAAATEYLQQFFERGSSLRDVGLDSLGIVLGLFSGWRWWRQLFLASSEID